MGRYFFYTVRIIKRIGRLQVLKYMAEGESLKSIPLPESLNSISHVQIEKRGRKKERKWKVSERKLVLEGGIQRVDDRALVT